ncbi:MAG: Rhomboid family protein [Pedosphaera sp.]|nr:Rhomboid family protein [Pedosphaera sp.]
MPEPIPLATAAIIAITAVVTLMGFKNPVFMNHLIFEPRAILRDKESYRLVTSGFLHGDWMHFAFNMFSLYSFGRNIEFVWGWSSFLFIYFASIIGGGLLALFLHRNHEYRAYGASGGVCGVIFASIFLFPGGGVSMFMMPFSIPSWLYAILFLAGSFYGIKRASDNIGHDAHLGGAIIGLLTTTLLYPEIIKYNPKLYAAVMTISVALLIYLIRNPMFLPLNSYIGSSRQQRQPAPAPALSREEEEERVNAVLEKVSVSGIQSLTKAEHGMLLEASRKDRSRSARD